MIFTWKKIILSSIIYSPYELVNGHGYMYSPRSRNWVAHQDGTDSWSGEGSAGTPVKEYCYHCLNNKAANEICGTGNSGNYDEWLDINGDPIPWNSQATYTEGEIITVKSYLSTNHGGHEDLFVCPDGSSSTQECLEANPLEYIDSNHGAPRDVKYPGRGYYSNEVEFEMRYKLPMGVTGDKVMLQWRYVTGNSCMSPGYCCHNDDDYFDLYQNVSSWKRANAALCTYPLDPTGATGTGKPELFWNCAEITILPSNGQPTTPSPVPPVQSPVTAPSPSNGVGCCSRDFKNCNQQLEGWCSESKENCEGSCMKWWLPNGAIEGCTARYEQCSSDAECCGPLECKAGMCELSGLNYPTSTSAPMSAPSPVNPSPPTAMPVSSGNFCCSQNIKDCITWCGTTEDECINCGQDVFWIEEPQFSCEARWEACTNNFDGCCPGLTCDGDEYYAQCKYEPPSPTTPTDSPKTPPPTTTSPVQTPPTTSPVQTPTSKAPTVTGAPGPQPVLSCSDGEGKTTWEALQAMESITYEVSQMPYVLAAVASGGAAGDGSYVVSESQAYAVLTAGLTILSMEENDTNYDEAKLKFEGYFNGWREMCRNSSPPPCQSPTYCDGGSSACLPGWKHLADFSAVEGTGAAPDGDEDAIVGMIIAVKAVESDSVLPSWYDEVRDWADRSCTQFLQDNTVLSSSSSHRLVKLGSCWGGWGSDGNNPSYHAPGHYRMMRDFQASIESRSYSLPSYVNSETWNMVIDTSYKFLETTQCPDTGLVPNWALVKEVNSQTLAKQEGSFSGSGTPQYEFGAEASRTIWRVAFDAAAYPQESASQSGAFLAPLYGKLVENFNPTPMNGWEYFGENSLQACSPIVSNVFGSWHWNYFISAPVFSSLVGEMSSEYFTGKSFDQQTMINAACDRVSDTANQGYYPLSWQVIAQMTLNGEVAKAGAFFNEPTESPTKAPTIPEGCYSINYMDCLPAEISNHDFCNKIWLPAGAQDNCVPLGGQCSNVLSCCGPAECVGTNGDTSCLPPADTPNTSSPTKAPSSSAPSSSCIHCSNVASSYMIKNGKDCTAVNLADKCTKKDSWISSKLCQLSCYDVGLGYEGDVCCNGNISSPTKAPSSSAPSSSCIHCDNVAPNYMIQNGKDCTAVNLANKCTKKYSWISSKFCQLSCYDSGLGYEGDVCCNGEAVN